MRWSVLLSFAAHFLKGGHEVIRGLRGKTPEVGHEVALVGLLQPNPACRLVTAVGVEASQVCPAWVPASKARTFLPC